MSKLLNKAATYRATLIMSELISDNALLSGNKHILSGRPVS
jgi:hypothetical protein